MLAYPLSFAYLPQAINLSIVCSSLNKQDLSMHVCTLHWLNGYWEPYIISSSSPRRVTTVNGSLLVSLSTSGRLLALFTNTFSSIFLSLTPAGYSAMNHTVTTWNRSLAFNDGVSSSQENSTATLIQVYASLHRWTEREHRDWVQSTLVVSVIIIKTHMTQTAQVHL